MFLNDCSPISVVQVCFHGECISVNTVGSTSMISASSTGIFVLNEWVGSNKSWLELSKNGKIQRFLGSWR